MLTRVTFTAITPSSSSRHDILRVLDASVLNVGDMSISAQRAIVVFPNRSSPESILWPLSTVENPPSVRDENDTITVQVSLFGHMMWLMGGDWPDHFPN